MSKKAASFLKRFSPWAIEKMYYICDAQSNVMATYSYEKQHVGGYYAVTIKDRSLYGSSRLGMEEVETILASTQALPPNLSITTFRSIGDKSYELSNHLGNVLTKLRKRLLIKMKAKSKLWKTISFIQDIPTYGRYYLFLVVHIPLWTLLKTLFLTIGAPLYREI